MYIISSVVLTSYIAYCYGLASYVIFPGFTSNNTEFNPVNNAESLTTQNIPQNGNITENYVTLRITSSIPGITPPTIKPAVFDCPEEEPPLNIGPYEVPTQKDLVLMTKKMLIKMLKRYNVKAFYLLKDIKQATRATEDIAKKCQGNRTLYRKCVKNVSLQWEFITKNLVRTLEKQRSDVTDFTKENICNMALMTIDPMELVKVLAMEEASLKFALPGFLRLLNDCFIYCSGPYVQNATKKPLRHLTDQDLIIQHLLTRKNYSQLINS